MAECPAGDSEVSGDICRAARRGEGTAADGEGTVDVRRSASAIEGAEALQARCRDVTARGETMACGEEELRVCPAYGQGRA